MATFTNAARKEGVRVRAANAKQRWRLAKKYDLTVSDFMPRQIAETAAKYNIPESLIRRLLPKDTGTSIPLSAVPERPNGTAGTVRRRANNHAGQQIVLELLTILNKLL